MRSHNHAAMTAGTVRATSDTRVERARPPTWRYIYFLLAAFDLVTVSAGLYLNHRIMGIYLHSVEVNRVWAERINWYSISANWPKRSTHPATTCSTRVTSSANRPG